MDIEKIKIMKIKESIAKYKRSSSIYKTTSECGESALDSTSKDYFNDSLYLPSILVGP
jgi:hypothetical protein